MTDPKPTDLDNTDADRCGYPTDDGDGPPCQRLVADDDRCFMHSDDGPPADHGAPDGNDFATGNAGGPGAPDGNFHALEFGVHVSLKRQLEFLLEEADDQYVETFANAVVQYVQRGVAIDPATDLAALRALRIRTEERLIRNRFTRSVPAGPDGAPVEVLDRRALDAQLALLREERLLRREEGLTAVGGDDVVDGHPNKRLLFDAPEDDADAASRAASTDTEASNA